MLLCTCFCVTRIYSYFVWWLILYLCSILTHKSIVYCLLSHQLWSLQVTFCLVMCLQLWVLFLRFIPHSLQYIILYQQYSWYDILTESLSESVSWVDEWSQQKKTSNLLTSNLKQNSNFFFHTHSIPLLPSLCHITRVLHLLTSNGQVEGFYISSDHSRAIPFCSLRSCEDALWRCF